MAISSSAFVIWAVDPLEKVKREAKPAAGEDRVAIEACRNEYTSAQVAVRATRKLADLSVSASALSSTSGATGVEVTARFVGYVRVARNTHDTPPKDLTCTAPCLEPDLLLEAETIDLEADTTQSIWLTIFVPPDAPAGRWTGEVEIKAGGEAARIPVELTVYPVTLPAERNLGVTNWIQMDHLAKFYGTELYTPRFWQVTESFARNLGAHRQNVVLCRLSLIQAIREQDGRLSFDYSNYDRWVQTFVTAGAADLIEQGHIVRFRGGSWSSPVYDWDPPRVRRRDGAEVRLDPETVARELVQSWSAHMKQKGWFDRAAMHLGDEPAAHSYDDYKAKSKLLHQWAPGVRVIEAIEVPDATGAVDIWVPKIDHFNKWQDQYLSLREKEGFELWFYTCGVQTEMGTYPNRFIDYTLMSTRLLHWLNWRYRLTGYLQWALNHWTEDPFTNDRTRDDLPAGDCWIVYPGKDGPLDSLRWEHMREGIQDYELFRLLDQRATGKADAICRKVMRAPQDFSRNYQDLRAARRETMQALAGLM